MIVVAYVWVILFSAKQIDAKIGINWGRKNNPGLIPSMVVDLLLQNHIQEVKLYSSDPEAVNAFAGTQIGVTISLMRAKLIDSPQAAEDWIRDNLLKFSNVNIRNVIVENNAFILARYQNDSFDHIVNGYKWVQEALNTYGYGDRIKAMLTCSYSGTLKSNIRKPSEAQFADDVKEFMVDILNIMRNNNVPFVFDFFPLAFVSLYNLDPNFAFLDNKSIHVVTDLNGLQYNNVFDFIYDSFVWAITKLGFPDLKVVVGQVGWPTDGFRGANISSAERFYKSLLPVVLSNKGTPMRPGSPIDIYIHTLTDERKHPLAFNRHWGIYRTNGVPKFKIDLTGQGRDIFPTMAKGIRYMPARWCVFNGIVEDPDKVNREFEFACNNSDCTSLLRGSSCNMLDRIESISYGFNMYFQSQFQDESACNFNGLGKLVLTDPSIHGCIFSIEVVKGTKLAIS